MALVAVCLSLQSRSDLGFSKFPFVFCDKAVLGPRISLRVVCGTGKNVIILTLELAYPCIFIIEIAVENVILLTLNKVFFL